jgi:rod shape-determining protein MreC
MFSFFNLFQKYGHFVLFFFLEIVSFYLIVNYNQTQKNIFIHSSSQLTGTILDKTAKLDEYIYLKAENSALISENARLLREVLVLSNQNASIEQLRDSSTIYDYDIIAARVINQNIRSTRNSLTLDKGSQDGISTEMGIINDQKVVGIIKNISDHFSTALSLLNVDIRVSSSLKNQKYFGTISWDGKKIDQLSLSGIPKYAIIAIGDSVVTNGYSTLFPPDILIGQVTAFKIDKSGDFFDISVQPAVDFGRITSVYAIKNPYYEELLNLQNEEQ